MNSLLRIPVSGPVVLLASRLLLALIFLHEGVAKLGNYAASAEYAESFGVPGVLLPLAIATELGCGMLLVLGLYTRIAALLLAGFCVFTAMVFHTGFADANQLLHFEKNLAMAGGLLAMAVSGPGKFSLSIRKRNSTD
jgi:putative oxidoreductase